jgi:subtilase family serine protease
MSSYLSSSYTFPSTTNKGSITVADGSNTQYSGGPLGQVYVIGSGSEAIITNPALPAAGAGGFQQLYTLQIQGQVSDWTASSALGVVTLTSKVTGQVIQFSIPQPPADTAVANNYGVDVQFNNGSVAFSSNTSPSGIWSMWLTEGGQSAANWGNYSTAVPAIGGTVLDLGGYTSQTLAVVNNADGLATYLNATGWNVTNVTNPFTAQGVPSTTVPALVPSSLPVGYIDLNLTRANDPSALLALPWAQREAIITQMTNAGTLWTTYGASQTNYDAVVSYLQSLGVSVLGNATGTDSTGLVSSAAAHSIWIDPTAQQFSQLFGQSLQFATNSSGTNVTAWTGSLSLPSQITSMVDGYSTVLPTVQAQNLSGTSTGVTLPNGPQSPGNLLNYGSGQGTASASVFPAGVVASLYNFPLTAASGQPLGIKTPTIGLLEPGIGSALPAGTTSSFQTLYNQFLQSQGITPEAQITTVGSANQSYSAFKQYIGERNLDVSVAGTAAPNSNMVLYAGALYTLPGSNPPQPTVYDLSAYQQAIWDTVNNPAVLSSSYNPVNIPGPGSPFYQAYAAMFMDAALKNMSVFSASGDTGSNAGSANGLPNINTQNASPYAVMVGGTSIATTSAAGIDPTLTGYLMLAEAKNPVTLQLLMSSGMIRMPTFNQNTFLLQSVWNGYYVNAATATTSGYTTNQTSTGGVDTSQATPGYQLSFGLNPTSAGPVNGTGRGVPDVSALAGGDMYYTVSQFGDSSLTTAGGGTSASAPLWAALTAQLDAIMTNAGFPSLGYFNDLLYMADAILPASFDSIQIGNNISSYVTGGSYTNLNTNTNPATTSPITPTGLGYNAQAGYSYATGLGTPDGLLLARALLDIANQQTYYPTMLPLSSTGTAVTASQSETVLIQVNSATASALNLNLGGISSTFAIAADTGAYAWNSQLAEQVLQSNFDPNLIAAYVAAGSSNQITPVQVTLTANEALSLSLSSGSTLTALTPTQSSLTAPFGFINLTNGASGANGGSPTISAGVALPVAIAETPGAANNQSAIVRMLQVSSAGDSMSFYKVDDLNGDINGIHPGDPGYAAAAATRAYQTASGMTAIAGPGADTFLQTQITHVNSGDLIAMALNSQGHTFYSFAGANEQVNGQGVVHLMNYGANTWGWNDTSGGGSSAFNSMIVQLDFVGVAGSQLTAGQSTVV